MPTAGDTLFYDLNGDNTADDAGDFVLITVTGGSGMSFFTGNMTAPLTGRFGPQFEAILVEKANIASLLVSSVTDVVLADGVLDRIETGNGIGADVNVGGGGSGLIGAPGTGDSATKGLHTGLSTDAAKSGGVSGIIASAITGIVAGSPAANASTAANAVSVITGLNVKRLGASAGRDRARLFPMRGPLSTAGNRRPHLSDPKAIRRVRYRTGKSAGYEQPDSAQRCRDSAPADSSAPPIAQTAPSRSPERIRRGRAWRPLPERLSRGSGSRIPCTSL